MSNMFISSLTIEKVRHLENITIQLSKDTPKHLILTGKNGSGKTSVLEAMSRYLNAAATSDRIEKAQHFYDSHMSKLRALQSKGVKDTGLIEEEKRVKHYADELATTKSGISVAFNQSQDMLRYYFEKGQLILAYYKADRVFKADLPKHVEKINLKETYAITDTPRQFFVKYLLDLRVTEALARNSGKSVKADEIKKWFAKFQDLLRRIFDDESLELIFDEDSFAFLIKAAGRDPFNFNSLSSGFAAVLDIVLDIIVRMEKHTNKSFDFNMPGIVLVDEIETHLHLELQKSILDLLTTVFPNVQFIVSTHSPFIVNSLSNAVIYDLENGTLAKDGLSDIPYSGIVEGYFNADEMSTSLKEKFNRYKQLVVKAELTDDDFAEIAELELFLSEIPDYLALNITTEYQQLKLAFEQREDV